MHIMRPKPVNGATALALISMTPPDLAGPVGDRAASRLLNHQHRVPSVTEAATISGQTSKGSPVLAVLALAGRCVGFRLNREV
jgi:hypothetical protein